MLLFRLFCYIYCIFKHEDEKKMKYIPFKLDPISKFNNFFLYQIPNLHVLNKSL